MPVHSGGILPLKGTLDPLQTVT